ncbi:colanic acid biosynthesis glycosyltransferase WcaL [Mangrovicoccus ximenensis]|uniref:colanic acid biosynthesis glycosyltransferase WcaL n=1 Tax=Mangrovicoccus ximenensis TaxID=1911570 RepID=UPI0011AEAEA5|nr:colanic acid biosynthesis glycosyltransferase WcaL [Mangrovicoccus ximenensis]
MIVLKGYPRVSETFIAQEILGLQQAGADIRIVSLRPPYDAFRHPVHAKITAPVLYLPETLGDGPRRVAAALAKVRRRPGFRRALGQLAAAAPAAPERRAHRAVLLGAEIGHAGPPLPRGSRSGTSRASAAYSRHAEKIAGLRRNPRQPPFMG